MVPAIPPFGEALRVWARIGLQSFGGPAGQIAVMHRVLVEERRWIGESRFLHALNYCMLLPGPEAMQLATYVGWLLHRTAGGLAAGILFVLPGFAALLGLSLLYVGFRHLGPVAAIFFGLKPAVLAVVVEAVVRIGRRALKSRLHLALAGAAFVAIFAFDAPFPAIIVGAGLAGAAAGRLAPGWLGGGPVTSAPSAGEEGLIDALMARGALAHTRPSLRRAIRVTVTFLALWFAPIAALARALGPRSVFVREALFFSKAAVVTFGGAYAVLAYLAQEAVRTYGWLNAEEMLDGLGFAETTPGPLIMVVQFVGFLGAHRDPGALPPLAAAVLGAVVTVWVTFIPCFLWIFLGAPWVEALRENRALRAALSAITAAVVGVILNLSIWFAIHVVFGEVGELRGWGARLPAPEWKTVSWPSVAIAAGALLAMLRWKVGMGKTLAASATLGLAWGLISTRS